MQIEIYVSIYQTPLRLTIVRIFISKLEKTTIYQKANLTKKLKHSIQRLVMPLLYMKILNLMSTLSNLIMK